MTYYYRVSENLPKGQFGVNETYLVRIIKYVNKVGFQLSVFVQGKVGDDQKLATYEDDVVLEKVIESRVQPQGNEKAFSVAFTLTFEEGEQTIVVRFPFDYVGCTLIPLKN